MDKSNLPNTIIPDIRILDDLNSVSHLYIPLSSGCTSFISSVVISVYLTLFLYLSVGLLQLFGGNAEQIGTLFDH